MRAMEEVARDPSLLDASFMLSGHIHYLDTRLHHTLISDTYTDCFYYTLINPFIIQPCVRTPVHVTRREP